VPPPRWWPPVNGEHGASIRWPFLLTHQQQLVRPGSPHRAHLLPELARTLPRHLADLCTQGELR
jgi:hypothetical protein